MYLTTRNDSYFPYELFREFFSDEASFPMRSDIYLDGDDYVIDVELPGVKKENVALKYENEYLTVTVEAEKNERKRQYALKERHYATTSRSFHLGAVDEKTINAAFENGVLTIRFPKNQPNKETSYRININ